MKAQIKEKLLTAGVKNLQEYGYPSVTKDNILTDAVYSQFFKSMLESNIGKAGKEVDDIIRELLSKIV